GSALDEEFTVGRVAAARLIAKRIVVALFDAHQDVDDFLARILSAEVAHLDRRKQAALPQVGLRALGGAHRQEIAFLEIEGIEDDPVAVVEVAAYGDLANARRAGLGDDVHDRDLVGVDFELRVDAGSRVAARKIE